MSETLQRPEKNSIIPGVPEEFFISQSGSSAPESARASGCGCAEIRNFFAGTCAKRKKICIHKIVPPATGTMGTGTDRQRRRLHRSPEIFIPLPDGKNGFDSVSNLYDAGKRPAGNAMSSFNYMTPADRFAVIHFIRSLHRTSPRIHAKNWNNSMHVMNLQRE